MFNGDAKTAYMREYMRQRRAGEAKIKPAAKFVGRAADELAKAKVLIQHLERELTKIRARRAPSPDEASERRIKSLTTENRNLKAKVKHMDQHRAERLARDGGLPRATETAIDKCLHPDTRDHASAASHWPAAYFHPAGSSLGAARQIVTERNFAPNAYSDVSCPHQAESRATAW